MGQKLSHRAIEVVLGERSNIEWVAYRFWCGRDGRGKPARYKGKKSLSCPGGEVTSVRGRIILLV